MTDQTMITAETGAEKARTGLTRSIGVAPDGSWVRRPTREEVVMQARISPESPVFPDVTIYDRIHCPLWIVLADDGQYADARPAVEEVTRGEGRRFLTVPAGHHLEQTHPEEVARIILDMHAEVRRDEAPEGPGARH